MAFNAFEFYLIYILQGEEDAYSDDFAKEEETTKKGPSKSEAQKEKEDDTSPRHAELDDDEEGMTTPSDVIMTSQHGE